MPHSSLLVINADGPETRVALVEDGIPRRALHRAEARAWHRGQHLQGSGRARAPRHAGRVRRHRPREERVPARRRTCAARPTTSSGCSPASRAGRPSDEDEDADDAARAGGGARIEDLLKEGQEVIVQVTKEPIGTKGARTTRYISLPGPSPGVHADGRSHRHLAPHRLRQGAPAAARHRRVDAARPVRASSCARSPRTCRSASSRATWSSSIKLWNEIVRRAAAGRCPALIYNDLDLLLRTVRDLFTRRRREADRRLAARIRAGQEVRRARSCRTSPGTSSCTTAASRSSTATASRSRSSARSSARCG